MDALSPTELARYSRQVLLPEIGVPGQTRLKQSRVLIIGAGGLGSPAALYLAAAGVGTIGIADFDQVEIHNLHRQLLHRDATVGQPKVESAAQRLRETNPHLTVRLHPAGVTPANALDLFADYDVIVDGTDNFPARYLNNDAAARVGRPLVHGSIYRFEGQVTVFAPHLGGPCYRCLFPEAPPAGSVPGCGEVGVLGALCGIIGSWQAIEAIKLITGCGEPLLGRLLIFDALGSRISTLPFGRAAGCAECDPVRSTAALDSSRYTAPSCENVAVGLPPGRPVEYPAEISVQEAKSLLDDPTAPPCLIDVREPHEWQICHITGAQHLPMRQIPEALPSLPRDRTLLVLCHHGGRSERVTAYLRAQGISAVTNIAGGIDAWAREIEPGMLRY